MGVTSIHAYDRQVFRFRRAPDPDRSRAGLQPDLDRMKGFARTKRIRPVGWDGTEP
ncbi:hypothetical protein [Microvirga sp. VF16]|uniref:hypothetical protein n=1 Tax=Microvirga sp. VF16 TaxID=2807101 RepID=UPI00193CD5E9|nr:hypothetical protein [Microvirga sp. VF16]QRM36054.1 hypothetical protein JO965_45585 [Microvirga sp. VF16]